jgi:hypothetical protein
MGVLGGVARVVTSSVHSPLRSLENHSQPRSGMSVCGTASAVTSVRRHEVPSRRCAVGMASACDGGGGGGGGGASALPSTNKRRASALSHGKTPATDVIYAR